MMMQSTLGQWAERDDTAEAGEQAEADRAPADPAPAPEADSAPDATQTAEAEPAAAVAATDDGALIDRIAQRDAAALAELYDEHIGPIYSLALRIVGEPDAAEAVVQEVFAQVWSGASRPAGASGSAARWLLALTRGQAIQTVRSHGTTNGESDGGEATVELPRPALGFDDDMGDGRLLRTALDRLPMLQRLCIELAFFDGLTVSQIAARLEQPEERVHKRIRSGLARLRDAIGDEG